MATKTTNTTKKSTSATKQSSTKATVKSTATKTTQKDQTPRFRQREARTLVAETGYVLAALTGDALGLVRTVPTRIESLREAPERIGKRRAKVREQLDDRVVGWGKRFDAKALEGTKLIETLRDNERLTELEAELKKVWGQADNTRSQVKAATTSVRKTIDAGVQASRELVG